MNDQYWPADWNSLIAERPRDNCARTAPVGKSDGNVRKVEGDRFDVRNLYDNVQEWCLEKYDPILNPEGVQDAYASTLGTNRFTPQTPWRVVCGGSWYDHDPLLWESTTRLCAEENERTDFRGFRVIIVEEAE
jgi:hypothetical protein